MFCHFSDGEKFRMSNQDTIDVLTSQTLQLFVVVHLVLSQNEKPKFGFRWSFEMSPNMWRKSPLLTAESSGLLMGIVCHALSESVYHRWCLPYLHPTDHRKSCVADLIHSDWPFLLVHSWPRVGRVLAITRRINLVGIGNGNCAQ